VVFPKVNVFSGSKRKESKVKTLYIGIVSLAVMLVMAVSGVALANADELLLLESLDNGSSITTAHAIDEEGELELEDQKVLGVAVKILCSLIMDGTVSANGAGEITKVLSLAGVDAGEPLVGPGITCTNTANCGGTPKVWAEIPPWLALLLLYIAQGGPTFFTSTTSNLGFEIECTVLGTKVTDVCTSAESVAEMTNEAGGVVDVKYSDAFQELTGHKLGTCTIGGAESGAITGLGTLLLTEGGTLSLSSE
jgi:hypothetical protein